MTGEEIKNRRLALNLTQAEFAAALGITETAVANWEQGIRKPATPQMLDMALNWLESQRPKSTRSTTTTRRLDGKR